MELLCWLQDWYMSMCDGGWEHYFGVRIETLDNPGWQVEIDLTDTPLENKNFSEFRNQNYESDDDWIICFVEDGKFKGAGDPHKLPRILEIFKNLAENC